jgi:hypothetical protein
MGLEDLIRKLRQDRIIAYGVEIPVDFNGITKDKIKLVLSKIGVDSPDTIDVVFALLDDQNKSWFGNAISYTFADGASTAHIGCHVGILQRGKNKLDREGRDYWIKPLRDLGIIEAVTFISRVGIFVPGHPIPKSSNSAYRLSEIFKQILHTDGEDLDLILNVWSREEKIRERAELRARIEAEVKLEVETKHEDLIKSCVEYYVPNFLKDFEVIFIDQSDGDRVTEEDLLMLAKADLVIALDDPMPDILLWNEKLDAFWVIEAVTSDGEVDNRKVEKSKAFINRKKEREIGFTTAYLTWKDAAVRQGRYKNIEPGTYIWILEDPSKHLLVESIF